MAQIADFRVFAPTEVDFDSVHTFVVEASFVDFADVTMRRTMQMLETLESC